MPIYTVEIDGKQYDLEGDHPPSEAEARSAVGSVAPQQATPPPASATIGMMAPSTKTSRAPTGTLMDYVPPPAERERDMGRMVDALPLAVATPSAPAIVAGAKSVPGVLARAAGISKVRAGANIAEAVDVAKAVPIDPAHVAAAADDMMQFKGIERVPMVVRKLVTELQQGPMNVERARQFYPALSRMSANDFASLTPNMQRLVGGLKGVMNEAITDAAATVGKGAQYASGMKEYAKAGKAAATWENKVKPAAGTALKKLLQGAGLYEGYDIAKKFTD